MKSKEVGQLKENVREWLKETTEQGLQIIEALQQLREARPKAHELRYSQLYVGAALNQLGLAQVEMRKRLLPSAKAATAEPVDRPKAGGKPEQVAPITTIDDCSSDGCHV